MTFWSSVKNLKLKINLHTPCFIFFKSYFYDLTKFISRMSRYITIWKFTFRVYV